MLYFRVDVLLCIEYNISVNKKIYNEPSGDEGKGKSFVLRIDRDGKGKCGNLIGYVSENVSTRAS